MIAKYGANVESKKRMQICVYISVQNKEFSIKHKLINMAMANEYKTEELVQAHVLFRNQIFAFINSGSLRCAVRFHKIICVYYFLN